MFAFPDCFKVWAETFFKPCAPPALRCTTRGREQGWPQAHALLLCNKVSPALCSAPCWHCWSEAIPTALPLGHNLVDPVSEVADAGVDSGRADVAVAASPGDDANQGPGVPVLVHEGTPGVTLRGRELRFRDAPIPTGPRTLLQAGPCHPLSSQSPNATPHASQALGVGGTQLLTWQEEAPAPPAHSMELVMRVPQYCWHWLCEIRGRETCCRRDARALAFGGGKSSVTQPEPPRVHVNGCSHVLPPSQHNESPPWSRGVPTGGAGASPAGGDALQGVGQNQVGSSQAHGGHAGAQLGGRGELQQRDVVVEGVGVPVGVRDGLPRAPALRPGRGAELQCPPSAAAAPLTFDTVFTWTDSVWELRLYSPRTTTWEYGLQERGVGCPAAPPGGSSGGLLGALRAVLWGCAQRAFTPCPSGAPGATWGAEGIAPHLNSQWAAVTTQFSLIREPPQKWDPERVWEERERRSWGWAGSTHTAAHAWDWDRDVPAGTPARARSRTPRSAH